MCGREPDHKSEGCGQALLTTVRTAEDPDQRTGLVIPWRLSTTRAPVVPRIGDVAAQRQAASGPGLPVRERGVGGPGSSPVERPTPRRPSAFLDVEPQMTVVERGQLASIFRLAAD